ncbi:twin-arginine translocase TatA/TatE family subunit [Pedobacter sp. MC2016-15]|uniref:Sec-independent protein translocase subunit TatA/TatB n=1 Tax=Pedobacter sp. MC2016-15 TaxID=2994473 RepID=UPI002AFF8261|nr:twin-arginine translocase TatA/TatE family subunit [Pedobacter sp. MC2016-15]
MNFGVILEFLNMGGGEIMLILGVVLLLFGGKKLPELARGLGKGIRDFKDASEGVKREIHRNINAMDIDDDLKAENEKYEQQHPPVNTPTLEEQMYPTAAAAASTATHEEVEIPASEAPDEVVSEAPEVPVENAEQPEAKPAPAPLGTPIAAYSATAAAAKSNAVPEPETVTPETASADEAPAAKAEQPAAEAPKAEAPKAPETVTPETASAKAEKPAGKAPEAPKVDAAASAAPAVETVTPDTHQTVPSETEKK